MQIIRKEGVYFFLYLGGLPSFPIASFLPVKPCSRKLAATSKRKLKEGCTHHQPFPFVAPCHVLRSVILSSSICFRYSSGNSWSTDRINWHFSTAIIIIPHDHFNLHHNRFFFPTCLVSCSKHLYILSYFNSSYLVNLESLLQLLEFPKQSTKLTIFKKTLEIGKLPNLYVSLTGQSPKSRSVSRIVFC